MIFKTKSIFQSLLFVGFAIPLHQDGSWQKLEFAKIKSNKVSFSKEKLLISINKSASPLIYPFKRVKNISSIRVRFKIHGDQIAVPAGKTQGDPQFDDFSFRLGLVQQGSKTLNWMERQIAPQWVLKMYELAPKGLGIENIHFLVATQQKKLVGTSRTHPLSEYFLEEYVHLALPEQDIVLEKVFSKEIKTVALWLSSDGDDTSAKYDVEIKGIDINYK